MKHIFSSIEDNVQEILKERKYLNIKEVMGRDDVDGGGNDTQ